MSAGNGSGQQDKPGGKTTAPGGGTTSGGGTAGGGGQASGGGFSARNAKPNGSAAHKAKVEAEIERLAQLDDYDYDAQEEAACKFTGLTKPKLRRAVADAQARLSAIATAPLLERMNRVYAVVQFGSSTRVAELEAYDPRTKRTFLKALTKSDFEMREGNQFVPVGKKQIPVAHWWLKHDKRRQYLSGVTLNASTPAPDGFLNQWRGFGVTECEGDPSIFLRHVEIIGGGPGSPGALYLLRWLVFKVQNPDKLPGTAIALQGEEGTGKGLLIEPVMRIFGSHAYRVHQPDHVVGRFNGHLSDALLLFADEAFFAGDPRHINILKALITELIRMCEQKFVDAYPMTNMLSIVIASNNDQVINATRSDRRFGCYEAPQELRKDREYFDRYLAALEDPVQLGAYLRHLRNLDLDGFDLRDIPQTGALTLQRVGSMAPHEEWLLDRLHRGGFGFESTGQGSSMVIHRRWADWMGTDELVFDYEDYCRQRRRPYDKILNRVHFGRFMNRYFPPFRSERAYGYQLGTLEDARMAFQSYHKLDGEVVWGGDEPPLEQGKKSGKAARKR